MMGGSYQRYPRIQERQKFVLQRFLSCSEIKCLMVSTHPCLFITLFPLFKNRADNLAKAASPGYPYHSEAKAVQALDKALMGCWDRQKLDFGSQSMPKIFIEVDWNCELSDLFALYFSFVSRQHVISGILGLAFNYSLWNSHGLAFFTLRHM